MTLLKWQLISVQGVTSPGEPVPVGLGQVLGATLWAGERACLFAEVLSRDRKLKKLASSMPRASTSKASESPTCPGAAKPESSFSNSWGHRPVWRWPQPLSGNPASSVVASPTPGAEKHNKPNTICVLLPVEKKNQRAQAPLILNLSECLAGVYH